jgi:hypothetical protein
MNKYKDVPDWLALSPGSADDRWYGVFTVIIVGLGVLTIRYFDTQLPVWGFLVVCVGMGVVLIIPEGILEGTTNQRV